MSNENQATPVKLNVEDYINSRLVDQLDWLSQKSTIAQARYKRLRKIELISASLIPFLTGFAGFKIWGFPIFQVIVGSLGVLIAVISGFNSLNKYQDIWVQYRASAEGLKQHLYLFQTGTGPYRSANDSERFRRLVENVEGILASENSDWASYIRQSNEDAGNSGS